MTQRIITAAMLAIGDELLSGRTKDKNIGYLADFLTFNAIDLKEVRIVSDEEDTIVEAVNALRSKYDYVFTSGGIGPTHDDMTADSIAKSFGVEISHHDKAMQLLGDLYKERGIEFTTARKRMARIPHGAELIENSVSVAPGFQIENVYVMAGIPSVFQAMLDAVAPKLETGTQILSEAINSPFPEGTIGDQLALIQDNNPSASIGSYPKFDGKGISTQIIIRARDSKTITKTKNEILQMFEQLQKLEE